MRHIDLAAFFNLNSEAGAAGSGLTRHCELLDLDLQAASGLAYDIAALLPTGTWILLIGDLGSGKTTWVQNLLQAGTVGKGLGTIQHQHQHQHRSLEQDTFVSSPTYAIVNNYAVPQDLSDRFAEVLHLDLYRIRDVRELFYVGFDSSISAKSLVLIEWSNVLKVDEWRYFFSYLSIDLPSSVLKVTISDSRSASSEKHRLESRTYALSFFTGLEIWGAFEGHSVDL